MNWILFSDRLPPLVENGRGATDYARVLVTNNLEARDAFGSMSHLWIGRPREVDDSGNGIGKKQWSVAEGGQYLTHWCDPAAADESAKPVARVGYSLAILLVDDLPIDTLLYLHPAAPVASKDAVTLSDAEMNVALEHFDVSDAEGVKAFARWCLAAAERE